MAVSLQLLTSSRSSESPELVPIGNLFDQIVKSKGCTFPFDTLEFTKLRFVGFRGAFCAKVTFDNIYNIQQLVATKWTQSVYSHFKGDVLMYFDMFCILCVRK